MVSIEELKLGNETLEALNYLLSQISDLQGAVSAISMSEIKDANTLTKEQIATLQNVKNAVEAINSDLSLKKTDFDEKKQNFDTSMSAFRNDKADFDEKKADFDSKNSTALINFAFISSNVEKINSTSALLAEAKTILEAIKPIEQRTQTALDTIANSQDKFDELEVLKTALLELKRSLENINTNGIINDNSSNTTQTYSSQKIDSLLSKKLDISEKEAMFSNGKIKEELLPNIDVTTKYNALSQNIGELEGSLKTKIDTSLKGVANGVATLDNLGKIPTEQLPKIDAYTKQESDDKFAQKINLPTLATETKAGITKLKNAITAKQEDVAVTEKAVSDAIDINKSIGIGQAYQDVWGQRELNIYYPNTTGRPIEVNFNLETTTGSYIFHIIVDDVVIKKIQSESLYFLSTSFIVPAGSKYKIATPDNTALKKLSICNNTNIASSWLELK